MRSNNPGRTKRRYAPYFDWYQKDRKEMGVIEDLFESLKAQNEDSYDSLHSFSNDPPDCVAKDGSGSSVAFEVTELVSEEAIHRDERGDTGVVWLWKPEQVTQKIDNILHDKDCKIYNGGPYSKVICVIHTDEYTIRYSDCARHLADKPFVGLHQIDEAYLLFSFDPDQNCCPYIKLRLEKSITPP